MLLFLDTTHIILSNNHRAASWWSNRQHPRLRWWLQVYPRLPQICPTAARWHQKVSSKSHGLRLWQDHSTTELQSKCWWPLNMRIRLTYLHGKVAHDSQWPCCVDCLSCFQITSVYRWYQLFAWYFTLNQYILHFMSRQSDRVSSLLSCEDQIGERRDEDEFFSGTSSLYSSMSASILPWLIVIIHASHLCMFNDKQDFALVLGADSYPQLDSWRWNINECYCRSDESSTENFLGRDVKLKVTSNTVRFNKRSSTACK